MSKEISQKIHLGEVSNDAKMTGLVKPPPLTPVKIFPLAEKAALFCPLMLWLKVIFVELKSATGSRYATNWFPLKLQRELAGKPVAMVAHDTLTGGFWACAIFWLNMTSTVA